jgi:NADP-dependent 3-hydroxy acid dehydrogenase YdfG
LLAKVAGRPVAALLANAGHGLGKAFLDQDFDATLHVIDTNIAVTIYVIQKVGRDMRARGEGRILVTGSIAGFMPGTYQAVYNGTKAFIDSFSFALRAERLRGHRHLPHAGSDRDRFLERADMLDTKVATQTKDDPTDVAKNWLRRDDARR